MNLEARLERERDTELEHHEREARVDELEREEREASEKIKLEKERAECKKYIDESLNYCLVSESFLFAVYAIVVQTSEGHSSFSEASLVLITLQFLIPILGFLFGVITFRLCDSQLKDLFLLMIIAWVVILVVAVVEIARE